MNKATFSFEGKTGVVDLEQCSDWPSIYAELTEQEIIPPGSPNSCENLNGLWINCVHGELIEKCSCWDDERITLDLEAFQDLLIKTINPSVKFVVPNDIPSITLINTAEEMLKVSNDGFWVRGVKVEQDSEEAQKVYETLKICLDQYETIKLLKELAPVMSNIFWLARCWNDHNFSEKEVIAKCRAITDHLVGGDRGDGVDPCNNWLARIEKLAI